MAVNIKYVLLFPIIAIIYFYIDTKIMSRNIKPNKQNPMEGVKVKILMSMPVVLLFFFKANDWFIVKKPAGGNTLDVQYALQWFCLPIASLIFAVLNVASRRGGGSFAEVVGKRTESLNIHHRYLANTVEQTIIFFGIHLVVATSWSDSFNDKSNLAYIACNCCLFTAGRILFFRYTIWPDIANKRTVGFVLTSSPSVFATIWCLYKLITNL
eukprot:338401_1